MKKLYLGNLSYDASEDDLRDFFSDYGPIESVKVITDKFSGKSKGFGFIELADDDKALAAIDELNEQELQGRSIRVAEARPQENRGGGGGGHRGGGGGHRGGGGGYRGGNR